MTNFFTYLISRW